MGAKAQALRALLNSGENFIAADVYTALTGRIVQHVGFKCAYLGGAACGSMHYAIPDIGILSQIEQIDRDMLTTVGKSMSPQQKAKLSLFLAHFKKDMMARFAQHQGRAGRHGGCEGR